MKGRRGAVLLQVLVFGVLAALTCSTILAARLQPALLSARADERVRDDLAGQGAVNRVTGAWTRLGVCESDAAAGVSCRGTGCRCSCEVEGPGWTARVVAAPSEGACSLTATRR